MKGPRQDTKRCCQPQPVGPVPQAHTARTPPVLECGDAGPWHGAGDRPGLTLQPPHSPCPRRCSPAPHPTWNAIIRKGGQLVAFPKSPQDWLSRSPPPLGIDAVGEDGGSFPHMLGVADWTLGTQDHECIPLCKVLLTLQTHLVPKQAVGSSGL